MNKYYVVLGLPTTASKDEVRKQYRKLVLIWHPDKNSSPEAHEKFIEITEAYDVLNGERKVPRTAFTTKRRAAGTPSPQAKKKTTPELFREKYLAERAAIRRGGQFELKKAEAARSVLLWKTATAVTVICFFIPWFISALNPLSAVVISLAALKCIATFAFHAHHLSKQAAMTFGESDKYDNSEIRDYFFPKHKLRW